MKNAFLMSVLRRLVSACFIAFPSIGYSVDLLTVYQSALSINPEFAAAKEDAFAYGEKKIQGLSLLLPQIGFESKLTYAWGGDQKISMQGPEMSSGFGGFSPQSKSKRPLLDFQLGFTQVLYDRYKFATYRQSLLADQLARAKLSKAQQTLVVEVAQRYFDWLNAQNVLRAGQLQLKAIERQLESAKNQFEVGNVTIMDVNAAKARRDQIQAMLLYYEADLRNRKSALNQYMESPITQIDDVRSQVTLPNLATSNLLEWMDKALKESPDLEMLDIAIQNAQAETDKFKANHLPKVELFGQYKKDYQSSTFQFFDQQSVYIPAIIGTPPGQQVPLPLPSQVAISNNPLKVIGIRLSMPLYTGGAISSQVRESEYLARKAMYEKESAKQKIQLALEQLLNGITIGKYQIDALQTALASAKQALEANQLGYEVGMQVNTEILNAQERVYSIEQQIAKARYDYLLNFLRLKMVAGELSDQDLIEVNRLLGSGEETQMDDQKKNLPSPSHKLRHSKKSSRAHRKN